MSSENWQFYIEYWDPWPTFSYFEYVGKVLSFSGDVVRKYYLDQYNGSTYQITIENNNDEAAQLVRGRYFSIYFEDLQIFVSGRISGITFNDSPGTNQGVSTATVTCSDPISQMGKFTVDNFVFPQDTTGNQAILPSGTYNQSLIPGVTATITDSIASTSTYSGTLLNKLNLLMNTEKGQMWPSSGTGLRFNGRSEVAQPSGITFVRKPTGVVGEIPYVQFQRIQLGDNFMNQVLIQPETVAAQFGLSQSSIDTFGPSGYSIPTLDYDTTQAAGLASWLAVMQGDPNDYSYEITVTDLTADKTDIEQLISNLIQGNSLTNIEWLKPGDLNETVVLAVIEGYSFNAMPGQTFYTFYFSSADFYAYFRLNDSIYGRLGGGGIVYNQAEITYDESGWTYNDSNADDTASRLGW